MKIRDVQIDGFGVWSGLSVDSMPEGMTVFYGPNEAGKTTLMNFLRTMFYGFTPERRARYLPPVHGGKPGGAMRVTGPGGGYEISRRATLNDASVFGQLTVTSSDGITQGQHRLTSLLGNVDESIFTNVFAIGLRELQELSTLDDTAAADELYKLSSGLDRVSLVDVIRQLRTARSTIASASDESAQLQSMLSKREKLRDEIEQLTLRGRRWGELASVRRNQQNEIEELKQRIEQWELESKTVETAIQIREPWQQRDSLRDKLAQLHARTDVHGESKTKLLDLQSQIDQKRQMIQSIAQERQTLRKRASELPLNRNILGLASKIESASEQGPWITQLQKQIQRLDSEYKQTQEKLVEDAKRLGLSDSDQEALLNDRRLSSLPDLSRPAISQLAGPARDVRMQQIRLKQAKERVESEKKEIERLQSEISGFLETRDSEDLQASIQQASERIASIRKFQQVDERLQKLGVHREELEGETIDLESDDGFSWERVIMLAIPFFIGAFMLISGLNNFFGWYNNANMPATARALQLQSTDTQNTGVLMTVLGLIILVATYLWWKSMEKGMEGELTDVETQLDTLVSQIRKTEHEKQELIGSLPEPNASTEQQLRQAEHELSECESYLPIYHNQAAAKARYNAARKQASDAAQGLKSARIAWKKTLHQLGLAESLSPKSLRILAEGYESLLITRKKLTTQSDELSQRRIELTSTLQKLDAIHTQMQVALASPAGESQVARKETSSQKEIGRDSLNFKPSDLSVEIPQQRLQQLVNTLAQQKQYLTQRKDLKLQDEELSKKQKGFRRSVDRLISARQSYLAEIGVESLEQLETLLNRKEQHEQLEKQIAGLDERIRTTLGIHVSYDAIERMLKNTPAHELEKRWETLTTRVAGAQERIGQLQLRQGEINQEMKTLAGDRRLAEAKLELSSLERQVELCADHWRTLGFTTCMLEKVCEIYESERQPETLREASAFLKQLTEGKYIRVWTPLGKNALRIDNDKGQSLPLEVLSRGTREAVFIALRLSLAAAYSRRGATLPLVLDDVLVNFDTIRATSAAKVLRDFAALGHQVVMFTCHEHIMRMFDSIGVQVRVLPAQGQAGVAEVYRPDASVVRVTEKISQKVDEKLIEPPALVIDVPVVTAQEPEPIVLPPRTRVFTPKPEPETTGAMKLVTEDPIVESLPLWFEHEWIDSEGFLGKEPTANPFASADSTDISNDIWTPSENLPLPMPADTVGLDGWWEDYAAQS
ncbi:MAG: ATP-binding protein [Planctomycetota bacterium]